MKGMILKDCYLTWRYYKPYFFISLLFIFLSFWTISSVFMLGYPLMLIGMIPMSLQSIDESYKWDVYCGSLPCTKKQIVSEKYLIGLIFSIPVTVLTLLANMLDMAMGGEIQWTVLATLALICWMLCFLTSALSLPLIFKFGSEKGRIAQYLIIGAVMGISTVAGLRTDGQVLAFAGSSGTLALMLFLPTALYALSWLLSIHFYEAREIR